MPAGLQPFENEDAVVLWLQRNAHQHRQGHDSLNSDSLYRAALQYFKAAEDSPKGERLYQLTVEAVQWWEQRSYVDRVLI